MFLDKELEIYRCDLNSDEFEDVLIDLHKSMNSSCSIEQLRDNPSLGVRYCDAVRHRCKCKALPDEMVMRRLANIRKRGEEKTYGE